MLYTSVVAEATGCAEPQQSQTIAGAPPNRHGALGRLADEEAWTMMLVSVLLVLAAADPAPAVPPAPPAAASAPPADDGETSVAGLQQVYDQSCAAREYGAYDDLCDQLRQQLRAARIQADRDARRKAAEARRRPAPPAQATAVKAAPAPPASPPS